MTGVIVAVTGGSQTRSSSAEPRSAVKATGGRAYERFATEGRVRSHPHAALCTLSAETVATPIRGRPNDSLAPWTWGFGKTRIYTTIANFLAERRGSVGACVVRNRDGRERRQPASVFRQLPPRGSLTADRHRYRRNFRDYV